MNKSMCAWLALLPALLMTPATLAADSNLPAVDRAKLAAFMEKWRTSSTYEYPEKSADWPLLLAALAKDPGGPWVRCIDTLAADARFQIRQVDWAERKAWAAALLSTLRQAEQLRNQLSTGGSVITNRPTPFVFEQGLYPESRAFLSLEAGQDLDALKAKAQRLLASAKDTSDPNYGQIVFNANESLGRIAVKQGDFAEARRCLRAAGKTRGSPTLNSFGPDFVLPHELLVHGTAEDREAVLGFLEDIRRLWADPSRKPEANSRRVAEDHLKELDKWCQEIRDRKIPDDRKWR